VSKTIINREAFTNAIAIVALNDFGAQIHGDRSRVIDAVVCNYK